MMVDVEQAIVEAYAQLRDTVKARYVGMHPPRLEAIARDLCKQDGIYDPDWIVMGNPGSQATVIGAKRLRIIELPLLPAWAWYVADAQVAIDLVERFPE
jgi:hypothetical protein